MVDAQLPPSLAEALRQAECEAIHVVDLGLQAATDLQIWDEAIALRSPRHQGSRLSASPGGKDRWSGDLMDPGWQYDQSKADRAGIARVAGNYRCYRTR